MFINLDGLEIMVRLRCEDIRQESETFSKSYTRLGKPWVRRALVWVGGLLIMVGRMLEKMGVSHEVYNLSTTTSR